MLNYLCAFIMTIFREILEYDYFFGEKKIKLFFMDSVNKFYISWNIYFPISYTSVLIINS